MATSICLNPLVVDRKMYVLARNNSIVALHAVTGRELWVHPTGAKAQLITNRGINYWESADYSESRLLFAVDTAVAAPVRPPATKIAAIKQAAKPPVSRIALCTKFPSGATICPGCLDSVSRVCLIAVGSWPVLICARL
jgi:hypothetical protein